MSAYVCSLAVTEESRVLLELPKTEKIWTEYWTYAIGFRTLSGYMYSEGLCEILEIFMDTKYVKIEI